MTESVLVSGGSGGIGTALCRRLADAGLRPVVGYASAADAAEATAAATGGIALPLDLTSATGIVSALDTLTAMQTELAGVVLAASPPPAIAPLFRLPDDEMAKQWSVNVAGALMLLDGAVKRFMRPRKKGWVVGVLSDAMGLEGTAAKSMGGYIVAKYGLMGLLKVLEAEYPWLNVRTVSPGYTETAMLDVFDGRFLDQMRAAAPGGRFATPGEVAEEIMVLVRDL